MSFDAWSRSVLIWAEARAKPQRKAQILIELLKKEKKKGIKDIVICEIVENRDFDYKDEKVVENILEKIKEFLEESEWSRNLALSKEFDSFNQKEAETNKDFVGRFNNLETKLRNEKVGISNMFLASWLMNKSRFGQAEKNNILANFDLDDKENILKNLKKKIRNMESSGTGLLEPKETLFGNGYGNGNGREFNRDRRSKSRSRSVHYRGRTRSKSNHRDYGRDGYRGGNRGGNRDGKEREDRGSKSPRNVKNTYTCENLRMDKQKSIFEQEVENKALVDSGCPEMVCGKAWMKTFEHSTDQVYEVTDLEDHFKFGDEVFKTITYKRIPLKIGSMEEMVDVGVVEAKIPLLISKRKLKEWGAKIDFEKNEMYIRKTDETIKLNETKSGHLTLNLAKTIADNAEDFIKEILLVKKEKKFKMRELKRIHRIFGHPSADKMEALLRDAGQDDKTILIIMRKIQDNCKVCKKHKRKASKPKVGLPKAREINETVSVDLKPVSSLLGNAKDNRQIVYMVDEFSKLTAAGISKSKEADDVAKVILDVWCLDGVGYPSRSFYMDNGTEFKKNNLEEVSRRLGIKLQLTPAYSPWSNGACERRHGTVDLTAKKLMEEDKDLSLSDAIKHAVWAKNIEIGRHGMSPFQIIYGKSPTLPGVSDGTVMSDSVITDAEIIRKHFQRQERARLEIRKADASRRLKEALKARVMPYNDETYEVGDKIIFEDKDGQWRGPAIVQAMESKTIFALHNGNLKKIAACKSRPWIEDITEDESEDSDSASETDVSDGDDIAETADKEPKVDKPNDIGLIEETETIDPVVPLNDLGNIERRPKRWSTVRYKKKGEDSEKVGRIKHVGRKGTKEKDQCWVDNAGILEVVNFFKDVEEWSYIAKQTVQFNTEARSENEIFYISNDDTKSEVGIRDDKADEAEGIFYLERKEPVEILAAMVMPNDYGKPEIQEAMKDELSKWEAFGAYEIIEDDGQETIDGRWVVNKKEEHDGLKVAFKARYCLRGFKEHEKPRSDSPTVDRISTKIFYAIAANEGWDIESIDVTSAFLQGEVLDRDIFVRPPKEANMPGKLWYMKKAAYGLYDASRRWWVKVVQYLISLGGKTLVGDESFLYFHKKAVLIGMINLHVDDFQGAGNDEFKKGVMDNIEKEFKISKRELSSFKYTGIDVIKTDDGIEINQDAFKNSLVTIEIEKDADNKRPLNKDEFKSFRGAAGKMTWLSECTRPDLSYDCLSMSCHNRDAKIEDLKEMNKLIKRATEHDTVIRYSKVGNFEDLKILGISDGAYLKLEEKTKSVAGRIIFLSNLEETVVSPILWKSKSIPTVCKSAKDCETRACDKTIEDAVYVARCFHEVYKGERGENQLPVDIVTDSKPLVDSIKSSRQVENKLLRPLIKFMKQCLDANMVNTIRWCDTKVCLADALTKKGSMMTKTLMDVLKSNQMIDLSWTDKEAMKRV